MRFYTIFVVGVSTILLLAAVAHGEVTTVVTTSAAEPQSEVIKADGGTYQITIDTSEAAALTQWAHEELAPVVKAW